MRVCVYDWNYGGHHPGYVRLFAAALLPDHEVIVAAPEPTLADLGGLEVERFSLGDPRPGVHEGTMWSRSSRDFANLRRAVAATRVDVVLVLYLDSLLRRAVWSRHLDASVVAYLHFPRSHYWRAYGARLPLRAWLRARAQQAMIRAWRARADASSVFLIDPKVATRWKSVNGLAPAFVIGEPPVLDAPEPASRQARAGAMIFGTMDARKGIDRVARALTTGCEGLSLQIVGEQAPEYAAGVRDDIRSMREAGVDVTRIEKIAYGDGLRRMGSVRCVILSFGLVPAGSRVLLEAATMETPVVAPNWGLVGHLVRTNGLGLVVDPGDPAAIRNAILRLTTDVDLGASFKPALRDYAERCGWEPFRTTVRAGIAAATGRSG